MGQLWSLAVARFRDRARRPAYKVTLLAAVALSYLAVPAADARWTVVDAAGARGIYDSGYVGVVTALASALWLTLGGFFVVRNALARDRSTRVGETVAASPLSTPRYLVSVFVSNVLVLASMALVVLGTAVVLQLARGESSVVDPLAFVTPLLVLALPLLTLTAAAAVLFEATPLLRSGAGNVLWVLVATVIAIGGQSPSAPLGGLGGGQVFDSFRDAQRSQGLDPGDGEFSLGLTYVDEPLATFVWDGFHASGAFIVTRALVIALALGIALLPTLWFARFDPARGAPRRRARALRDGRDVEPQLATTGPSSDDRVGTAPHGGYGALVAIPERGRTLARLWSAELRILLAGTRWWWWGVLIATALIAVALPEEQRSLRILLVAVWPVTIWSRLGSQRVAHGTEELLASHPWPQRRVWAEWGAGFGVTVLVVSAPAVRSLLEADLGTVASLGAAAVFIPSLALALGTLGRSHLPFQALYALLWYLSANGVGALDVLGAVREGGQPVGPTPSLIAAGAASLLTVAVTVEAGRAGALARAVRRRTEPG